MDSPHRIQSLTPTPTISRQTPRNEFGEVLAQTLNTGAQTVSAFVGVAGGPVLSAAVAGVTHISGNATAQIHAATAAPVQSAPAVPGGMGGGASSGSSGMDLLEAQRALQAQSEQFNAAYLQLQDQMQRESREFEAVSNVMKVRHDSAKAAINNIH